MSYRGKEHRSTREKKISRNRMPSITRSDHVYTGDVFRYVKQELEKLDAVPVAVSETLPSPEVNARQNLLDS